MATPRKANPQPGGRPTAYKPEMVKQAAKLCALGATDMEIADFFGVAVCTISRWKNVHPEFCSALKVAKEIADNRVERSLFNRAVGYTYDAVKILQYEGEPVVVPYEEHVPPDTTACIFWLKNRKPEEWRDRHQVDHSVVVSYADLVLEAANRRPAIEGETVKPETRKLAVQN